MSHFPMITWSKFFYQLKLIKIDHCTSLSDGRPDQLVRINVEEGSLLEKWYAINAIEIWCKEKFRRLTASSRTTCSTDHSSKD